MKSDVIPPGQKAGLKLCSKAQPVATTINNKAQDTFKVLDQSKRKA